MSPNSITIAANNGDLGGGEIMQLSIATALRELGHVVTVLGPAQPSELIDRARELEFDTEVLPATSRTAYILTLRAWRRRHRSHLLWCNGLVPSFATVGLGPRIVHLHTIPTGRNRWAAALALRGALRVLVPSHYAADRIPGTEVLLNWTAPLTWRPPRIVDAARVRIGFIGRIHPDKGIDVLSRALPLASATAGNRLELVLAGQRRDYGSDASPAEAALDALDPAAEELGWVSFAEFAQRVDLAVLPSVVNETFGLVVAEAMAVGLPFVISDSEALTEVAGSSHPWVARRSDPADLARVITEAIADLSAGDADRSRAARVRWERHFSPNEGRFRLARLLESVDLDPPLGRLA